jgi:hypothetical protein
MDFFEKHKAVVEKAIYFKMADLMNADVDLIFYVPVHAVMRCAARVVESWTG